ncbi:hypothetical protein L3Q82_025223, partial [Scortum barcoo]
HSRSVSHRAFELSMEPLRTLKPLFSSLQHWIPTRCVQPRYCSNLANSRVTSGERRAAVDRFRSQVSSGPSFQDFIKGVSGHPKPGAADGEHSDNHSYLSEELEMGNSRKVYFETYGCQMNVNDTDIAWSILQRKGYQRTVELSEVQQSSVFMQFLHRFCLNSEIKLSLCLQADVVLLMYQLTDLNSSFNREKAEQTIWNRLQQLTAMKKKRLKTHTPMKIGILGCMAERLKTELLEREKLVDVLAGPDAYRDLPRLLTVADGGQQASNVLLSLEETYADIMPVHHASQGHSAFVSIMRGCDNMCSYCIVPFTRGRERSRPVNSILEEVRMLSDQASYDLNAKAMNPSDPETDQRHMVTVWLALGYCSDNSSSLSRFTSPQQDEGCEGFTSPHPKVTLLGQNVNSYRDTSEEQFCGPHLTELNVTLQCAGGKTPQPRLSDHLQNQTGRSALLRPAGPSVLHLIAERRNICNQIHLPAQSGSSEVLKAGCPKLFLVRRTREAYLDLVKNIKRSVSDYPSLSSDFISGFCGETEDDHQQTLSLIREVGYNVGFLFAYSMRKKTQASHRLQDDVPAEVKQRRLEECISVFREEAMKVNAALIGSTQLVLVEGESKRSAQDLCGRTDGSMKVIFPKEDVAVQPGESSTAPVSAGDYVLVKVRFSPYR